MKRAILLACSLCVAAPTAVASAQADAALLSLEDRRLYEPAAMVGYLSDRSPAIRRRAALAAARLRDPRAVAPLVALLADPDSSVAATAAFALGQIGDSSAVAALTPLLDARRAAGAPTVVAEAASALGRLRTAASRAALEGWLRDAPRTGRGVRESVGAALLAVWRFPRPADAAPIVPWLASADTALAWRAAYALTRRPDPAGSAALAERLGDASPLVRSFAMRGLTAVMADSSGLGRVRALPLVLGAVRDRDHAVAVNAVRTLASYDAPESIAELARLLANDDPYLAITAAEGLGRLGVKAAAAEPALRSAVAGERRPAALRAAALAALAAVSPASARSSAQPLAAAADWRLRAAAARAAAQVGDRAAVDALAHDRDGRVVAAAIEGAVEAAGDTVGVIRPLLTELLGHPDPIVRTNALGGFAKLADPSDVPLLLDAYERALGDTALNDAALGAIAALGAVAAKSPGAGSRAFFARFPRSRDYLVRLAAAQALVDSATRSGWGVALPIEGALTPEAAAQVGGLPRHARIVTSRGTIELELFPDEAPLTVRNFATLARRGFFDGQVWPRVVPNFVIQGGDPRGDTSGGPGYAIRDEINRHRYGTGTLGMALSGPDTGGSQWFITHTPQPHLDGTYAVFGRVLDGMAVVNAVIPGDRIERIEVMP